MTSSDVRLHDATPTSEVSNALNVVVLRWPEEAAEARRLAEAEQPRLLLVAPGADPPDGGACQEDWVRLPVDDRDIAARLRALRRRVDLHVVVPVVDDEGRLIHRRNWVSLSPIEEQIVRLFVERFGEVVSWEDLLRVAWSGDPPTQNALRVHLFRLRRRIAPLGLEIRGVRSHGQVMEEGRHFS